MFTRPCLLASWNIYALLQQHTVKNSKNATIFAVYFKLTINVINPICKQECWGCISHSDADFNLCLFSTQTHLFMVGSWKESTTICQDILYFSEPSISEIRSVKTQNHTINSANLVNEHREQICTKLLTKNSHFLLWGGFPWTSVVYVLIHWFISWAMVSCYWTAVCLNHTVICKSYFPG